MISVITVNYNTTDVTIDLLKSIERLGRHDLEVIVVDNGSKQDPSELILQRFPWVKVVRSEVNYGFAGGNNLGIQHSSGDYLFFVNNDTEFKSDVFGKLRESLALHPGLGVVCPVLHYFDHPQQIQFAGFTDLHPVTARNKCITTLGLPDVESLSYTEYAHGAAMMMPRHVIEKVGVMPEEYFLYYEEYDWSERIKNAGYAIAVDNRSVLYHKESQSTGAISELKSYFLSRNRILFMRRNAPTLFLFLFWMYYLVIATPVQVLRYVLQGRWGNSLAHMAGIIWNITSSIESKKIGYKFNDLRNA